MWVTFLGKLGLDAVKARGWIVGLILGALVAGGAFVAGYKFARDEMINEALDEANKVLEAERSKTLETAKKLEGTLAELKSIENRFESERKTLEQKYGEESGNDRPVFTDDELRDYNAGNEKP